MTPSLVCTSSSVLKVLVFVCLYFCVRFVCLFEHLFAFESCWDSIRLQGFHDEKSLFIRISRGQRLRWDWGFWDCYDDLGFQGFFGI